MNFIEGVDCVIDSAVDTDVDKYGRKGIHGYASDPERGAIEVRTKEARQMTDG